jgi:hypothetical protein
MYTGGIYDKDMEQYYLNARYYYNPVDGNFLMQDTYRGTQTEPNTWNLYAIVWGIDKLSKDILEFNRRITI